MTRRIVVTAATVALSLTVVAGGLALFGLWRMAVAVANVAGDDDDD